MLRNPAAAELAADSGCIDSCMEAMQACERDNFSDSATGTQWVLRQVCIFQLGIHTLKTLQRVFQHAVLKSSKKLHLRQFCNMLVGRTVLGWC